jgi:ubiquitin-protein ligase
MPPTALAIRRITIDTKRVMEMSDSGFYWIPDEIDVTHGWAVICALDDASPYYGGVFSFEVQFPDNYPYEPPKFTYLTNDGRTRFNPNLYMNGKVCLSLLNTWQGEQWSGVQSLASILQNIQSIVLCPDPLRNEPAYSQISIHADIPVYNRVVTHAVLKTAIIDVLTTPADYLVPVYDAVFAQIKKAAPAVIARAEAIATTWDGKKECIPFYRMTQPLTYTFAELASTLKSIV